jgi:hypothetical protein
MIISKINKYVFVAIPKTGTRAVYKILKDKFGGELHKEHYHTVPEYAQDYFKFTIVRNPYERAISLWWSVCKRQHIKGGSYKFTKAANTTDLVEFLTWLNKKEIIEGSGSELSRTQSDYLKKTKFDKLLYTESLSENLREIELFKDIETLPLLNDTFTVTPNNPLARNNWKTYMTTEVIKLINSCYTEDFELLPKYKKITDINSLNIHYGKF